MRVLIAALAAFFMSVPVFAQSIPVQRFEKVPVEVAVIVFNGQPTAATQALQARGHNCRVFVDPVRPGRFLVAYGRREFTDGRPAETETRVMEVRPGDYIRLRGVNSCPVEPKARFEREWRAATP